MTTERPLLDHENLDAYRVSIELLSLAVRILEAIPSSRRELRSQLERAAMSVPLDIAEGCGRQRPRGALGHGPARAVCSGRPSIPSLAP
jgi:hypothetical protein